MKIYYKLPAMVIGAAVLTGLLLGLLMTRLATEALFRDAGETLTALRHTRHAALIDYLTSIEEVALVLAQGATVGQALEAFGRAHAAGGPATARRAELLRALYGSGSDSGRLGEIDRARQPWLGDYHEAHDRHAGWFDTLRREVGFHDVFLVDRDGLIVFSAAKESDFATNLVDGPWANTGLGRAVRGALASAPEARPTWADFAEYAPSGDVPAAFIAAPVVRQGEVVGALALQVPSERLSRIMNVTAGMGESGETYIVGSNYLMRSISRFDAGLRLLQSAGTSAVDAAIDGQAGVRRTFNYLGRPVLSAFQPVAFPGLHWAIVAEKELAQIAAPIRALQWHLALVGGLATLAVASVGLFFAIRISGPLAQLNRAIAEFAATRKATRIEGHGRRDELGEIARAFSALSETTEAHIAELQAARAEAAEASRKLRLALDNMADGLFVIDADMRFSLLNERYREMLGLDETVLHVGADARDVIRHSTRLGAYGEGAAEEIAKRRLAELASPEVVVAEARVPNGATVEIRTMPREGGGCVGLVTDVSERRRMEAALRDSERRLVSILEQSPISVGLMRIRDSALLFANGRFHEMFGYGAGDAVGRTAANLYFDEAERQSVIQRFKADGAVRDLETHVRHVDGRDFWVLVTLLPFEYEGEPARLAWSYDITERRRAEEEISRQHRLLDQMLGAVAQGVVKFDAQRRVEVWNDNYRKYLALPAGMPAKGQSVAELMELLVRRGDYGPGEPGRLVEARTRQLWNGSAVRAELVFGDHCYDVLSSPTGDGGVVIAYTDITERKQAEEELRASERLVTDILERLPVGTGIARGSTGRVVFTNAHFRALFGVSEAESFDSDAGGYYADPADRPRLLADLAAGREVRDRELLMRRSDGSPFWALATLIPCSFEGEPALLGCYYDIAERRAAAEEIARQRQLLDQVLSTVAQGVVMYDPNRRLEVWNDNYQRYLGYPDRLMTRGRPMREIVTDLAARGAYGAGEVETLVDERMELYWGGRGGRAEVSSAGRYYDLLWQPTYDDGRVFTFTDISERKRAEEEIRGAYQVIQASVQYASQIQRSLLPAPAAMASSFADHFVVWEPRDVVGGDFYWLEPVRGGHLLVVGDCTGHGVPGAFMTILCTGALNRALYQHRDGDPAAILATMNQLVKRSLLQDTDAGYADDGMELGACRIGNDGRVTFAGARFSLLVVSGDGAREVKGNRTGIGYRRVPADTAFTNHAVGAPREATFYLATDGLVDQIGGAKRRSFGRKRLISLLQSVREAPLPAQRAAVVAALREWTGGENRRDDVTAIGFRLAV